jgi:hypothetical protein
LLQMLAKSQSVSKLLKTQCDRRALLQAYHGAESMGLHPNGQGLERVSDCAAGVSDAVSR